MQHLSETHKAWKLRREQVGGRSTYLLLQSGRFRISSSTVKTRVNEPPKIAYIESTLLVIQRFGGRQLGNLYDYFEYAEV